MFSKLVSTIRHLLEEHGEYSMNLGIDETPPRASFHATLDGYEYVIVLQPTRTARLNDAGEPNPPTGDGA